MNRILLIEKNTFIREALREILHSRFPLLCIEEVSSYEEARSSAGDFNPDVLILGLTEYEGLEIGIIRKLREKYPAAAIVLFVDYDTEEYRKKAFLSGANHIISKELWTGREILALMKTILAAKEEGETGRAGDPEEMNSLPERRRKDGTGLVREREYLSHFPDRRHLH
ncbi:MAG: response regulator [Desulfobulbaceae bacterium]|nr:response regulator [Desulfobulbaceae bacterium]